MLCHKFSGNSPDTQEPSENSLRHRNHHLKPSVNYLDTLWKFTKYFPDALSDSQATFQTLRKHSGYLLRDWKHSWQPSGNFSEHSGNVPETRLDTGKHPWKPQSTPDTLRLLKYLLECSSEILSNSPDTQEPSKNSLDTGNSPNISQMLLQKLSGNFPDTQETSGNSLRH